MQGTKSFTSHHLPFITDGKLPPLSSSPYEPRDSRDTTSGENVVKSVRENAVIVIGRRGCCMCHVVKKLMLVLGVNPAVIEFDEEREDEIVSELVRINYGDNEREGEISNGVNGDGNGLMMIKLPAVFVGGKLYGGLDRVMAAHISGELVPTLKDAGALWL